MRRAGNSVSDIIRSTSYAKSTIYRVVAAFDAEGKSTQSSQWSKENQIILCKAEKDVELRPKPVNVKTDSKEGLKINTVE